MRWQAIGVALAIAAFAAGAAPSRAAFPGTNGRLLISRFEEGWDYVRTTRANGRVGERVGRGYHAAWSPDGRRVAFSDPDRGGLFVVPADASESPSHLSIGIKPTWSPDGRRIAFVYLEPGSPPQVHTIGATAHLGHGRAVTTDDRVKYTPAWSPDGRWIAYGVGDDRFSDDLYMTHPDGSAVRRLTSGPGLDASPSWSPDGTRIAFSRFEPGAGRRIFSLDVRSGSVTQLTSQGVEVDPVWSPDGRWIAFGRYEGPLPAPWLMNAGGGGERRLTQLGPRDHVLDWQRTIDLGVRQRARVGLLATVTVAVRNSSPGPSVGGRLRYPLPARATLVSAAPSCAGTRTIRCRLGTIAAGRIVRLRFVLRVRGPFVSRVLLVTRQVDPRPADNRSTLHVAASRRLTNAVQNGWQRHRPIPVARTEVAAAAAANGRIVVVGGYLADGATTARADEYSTRADSWRQLPDLPVAVNHAMAAAYRGRVYVVGGYGGPRRPLRSAFVLDGGDWRRLPAMPAPRAAAAAAVAAGRLYIVGGVASDGLARTAFAYDFRRRRWTRIPGPTPREHLAAAAVRGRVYALAGRTAGLDTNVRVLERYAPTSRRWIRLRPIPSARGGTAATAVGSLLVSVGGEAPAGTIASVYAFDVTTRRWRRLPDLPTPRHGLGVVAVGRRVYAVAGGPRPGLTVSGANESLLLGLPTRG